MIIKALDNRDAFAIQALLGVWESSVRATHLFLGESDIRKLRPLVREGLEQIPGLFAACGPQGEFLAFMGVDGDKIEMLFVSPEFRGQKIGRLLLTYGLESLGVEYVDVNEQNTQALGFYEHLGFEIFSRSPKDGQGRDFPILSMKIKRPGL